MSCKSIFVPVFFEHDVSCALKAAYSIAEKLDGHIIGYHVRPHYEIAINTSYHVISPTVDVITREQFEDANEKRAQKLYNKFSDFCRTQDVKIIQPQDAAAQRGVTASWIDTERPLAEHLGAMARVSDMIVMPYASKDPIKRIFGLFDTMLLESGRPLVLIPREGAFSFPKNMVVAWDGSKEAAHALKGSIPLLKRAKKVTVVTIGEVRDETPDTAAAVSFLKCHGIQASAEILHKPGTKDSTQLLDYLEMHGCDCLVMGAYSHSRVRQVMFGGVTKRIVDEAKIPVVMMH